MTIILRTQEAEEYFFNALCNGLSYIRQYGLILDYNDDEYKQARSVLKDTNPKEVICIEDVLMQILRMGFKIALLDTEDDDARYEIGIDDVHNRMSRVPINHLTDMYLEIDDANTADAILQTIFLNEIIYG